MLTLSNHLNDKIQPKNNGLNNSTLNLKRTEQVTLRCRVCNLWNFTTYRGPNQHLKFCSNKPRDPDVDILANQPCSSGTNETNERENSVDVVRQLICGERNGEEVAKVKAEVYEKVLFWKRNLFRLPTGVVEKSCTTIATKLMNGCVNNSPFKNIAFKATRVMPRLLLPTKQNMSWPQENWRDRRIYFLGCGNIKPSKPPQ